MAATHDAFVSYSRSPDQVLAASLEKALEQFARPLWKRRTSDIFLDQSSLGVDVSVWGSIEPHLEGSRWFVFLASPQAANSAWCTKEIEWWLAHRGTDRLLIVVTAGEVETSADRSDFDWARTTALPRCLAGRFSGVPLYGDLRTLDRSRPPTLRDRPFRQVVVGLLAKMRGVSPDALDGEDLATMRRNRRAIAAGGVALLSVAAFAGVKAIGEVDAGRDTVASTLVASALTERDLQPARALLRAALAQRLSRDGSATLALVDVLSAHPRQVRTIVPPAAGTGRAPATAVHGGLDRVAIARCTPDDATTDCRRTTIDLQSLEGGSTPLPAPLQLEIGRVHELSFTMDGTRLLAIAEDGAFLVDLKQPAAAPERLVRGQPVVAAALSADGSLFAAALSASRSSVEVKIWNTGVGIHRCQPFVLQRVAPNGIVFSQDGSRLAVTDGMGRIMVTDLAQCARLELRTMDTTGALAFDASAGTLFAVMLDGTRFRWNAGAAPAMDVFGGGLPLVTSRDWLDYSPHALSPDGRLLALGDGDQVRVDAMAQPGSELLLKGFPERVVRTRFASDRRWLLTGHADRSVILWRLSGTQHLSTVLAEGDPARGTLEPGWQRNAAQRMDGALSARLGIEADRASGGDTPGARWTLALESHAGAASSEAAAGKGSSARQRLLLASGSALEDPPEAIQFTADGKLWLRTEQGRIMRWDIDPASLEARACAFAGRAPAPDELDGWLSGHRVVRWQAGRAPLCTQLNPHPQRPS
jgi:hypothetical protein